MKYKDLFIDFDDTLYDTHGNAVIALHQTFEAFGMERWFADPEVFYNAYWEANIDLWTRYARGEISRDYLIIERFRRPLSAGRGVDATAELCLAVSDRFLAFCASKPGVVDGAHELMDYLQRRGYRLHMASNGFHEVQYRKLAACGLDTRFDTIILSEDAQANKPSPAFFEYALKVTGAERRTTLMIGDNLQTDIAGALSAGIDALLFNRWDIDLSTSTVTPTFVAATLRDIMKIL